MKRIEKKMLLNLRKEISHKKLKEESQKRKIKTILRYLARINLTE